MKDSDHIILNQYIYKTTHIRKTGTDYSSLTLRRILTIAAFRHTSSTNELVWQYLDFRCKKSLYINKMETDVPIILSKEDFFAPREHLLVLRRSARPDTEMGK